MDFLYELKMKSCPKIFSDKLGEGVLVSQVVSFPNTVNMAILAASLLAQEHAFIEEYIEVIITEL